MKKDRKLKILIIPSWYPSDMDPNGVPFIRAQAQALVRAGHDVTVVFTQAYSLKTVVKQRKMMWGDRHSTIKGVKEILSYLPKTHLRRFDELTRLIQGKRLLKSWTAAEGCPDIVHVHTYLAGQLGVWYHQKYNTPLITTEHYTGFARGIVKNWEMKRARKLYMFSSLNLAVSGAFASLLQEKTGAPFIQLPNMVNTDLFTIPSIQTDKKDTFTFLFVGLLHDKKNPIMLLQAFIYLYRKDSSLRLVMAGEGKLEQKLKSMVKNENLQKIVTFPGFINSSGVASLMRESDAFILPSKFETFGIVVIEAMASGLPVIVTMSGGPESFVNEGENGLIIDQDREQLESAMFKAINQSWDKNIIRKFVIDHFSEKAVIKRLEQHYHNVSESTNILQASREISVSGGISKVAYQLALQLEKRDYSLTTITTEIDEISSKNDIGRVIILPMPGWLKKLPPYFLNYFKTLLFTQKVHSLFKHKNSDPHCLTISHRDSYGANIAIGHSCHREAIEIKKKEGSKLWWLNPIHNFYLKEEKKICSQPYPELAAISRSIADEYHRHYKLPENFIHTIPNGVDIDRFVPDTEGEARTKVLDELSLGEDSFILLFVGNEFKRKGLNLVIESLDKLKNENVHLIVLGGADSTEFERAVGNYKLEDQVHFLGRRSDAPLFFSAADLFVIPANYEPFGLVGIEAMSSGTPILAPALGGFNDYLKDGENGYFIERDTVDITVKIEYLKQNRSVLKQMSINARKTAEKYSWDRIGDLYSKLIDSL